MGLFREARGGLAIAMNRLGGKSNTGEGGEDMDRFPPMKMETREDLPKTSGEWPFRSNQFLSR